MGESGEIPRESSFDPEGYGCRRARVRAIGGKKKGNVQAGEVRNQEDVHFVWLSKRRFLELLSIGVKVRAVVSDEKLRMG